jgi:putative DNA primase/helicase
MSETTGTLAAALAYAKRGWPVFPCRGKQPAIGKKKGGQGYKDATTDPDRIREWWRRFPNANIGIATGSPSGFWVLDIDPDKGGTNSLAELCARYGPLPESAIQITGSGGQHILFRFNGEGIRNRVADIAPGLDTRATGGYIVAAPSIHPDTGAQYQWDAEHNPAAITLADAPAWLVELVSGQNRGQRERSGPKRTMNGQGSTTGRPGSRYAEAALDDECRAVAGMPKGGRNARLNEAAFNLGQLVGGGGLERGRVERALFAAAERCGLIADDGEGPIMATINSGLNAGMAQPREAPEPKAFKNGYANGKAGHQSRSDDHKADPGPNSEVAALYPNEDAIALVFADRHADTLRYCHDWGMWLRWDGTRWVRERRRLAFHFARELAREANPEGKATPAKASTAGGVERFAQADPKLATISDEWDTDQWLLNTPGGTVDLRTGELRPHQREDHITKQTAVTPAPALHDDHPLWTQFLEQATKGDKDLQRFLQQIAGYCLTGDVSEECLFFVYGPGGNGKGVFLQTIGNILSDYAASAAMDTFTASHNDRHPTDLAKLRGARMVTASETEEGRAWAESRIKELTGNERPISARFMRQDFFEYWPTFKLVFVGNHKPVLRNVDDAARRRFNIIPFTHKPKNPDPGLKDKLRAEYPAILRWMIDGCVDWRKNRLVRPSSVGKATEEYFKSQDMFGQWLEEACELEPGNDMKWETAADLFSSWKSFCESQGEQAGSSKALGDKLTQRDIDTVKKKLHGKTVVARSGIQMVSD